jgi:negative regulator of sigma-B (phosphoserine phosphatase)
MATKYDYSIRVRAFLGERVSGDAAIVLEEPDGLFIALIDALGHGQEAHEVANIIVERLQAEDRSCLCSTLSRLHEILIGTRGAAAGIAHLNTGTGNLRYAGIGNTVIRRIGRKPMRLVSRDGTLGHIMRTPREEHMTVRAGDVVLFYTDGVQDHFDLRLYPAFEKDSATAISRNIVQLFGKAYDDAACIALKAYND